jgi:ribose/xylose/arabinose/galactoside ABC-type transport system permease subunit
MSERASAGPGAGAIDVPPARRPGTSARGARAPRVRIELLFPLLVLVALCVVLSIVSPYFLTQANLSNLLGDAAVLAMVSFGVTVVVISGNFDLSVGSGVGLAGMSSAWTMVNTGSVLLGVLVGLATGVVIGLSNGILSSYLSIPSFIATLAMLVIARGIALTITDGTAVTELPDAFTSVVSGAFLGIANEAWIALALLLVVYLVLHHTRLGVQIFAVGGNAEAARLAGISVNRVRTAAFVISGVAMAIAGMVLAGRLNSAQPNAGQLLELYAVAAVVLGGTSLFGGRGSVAWTVVGVLLIAVIQNGLTLQSVDANVQNIVLGIVFVVAALTGVVRRRAA